MINHIRFQCHNVHELQDSNRLSVVESPLKCTRDILSSFLIIFAKLSKCIIARNLDSVLCKIIVNGQQP